MACFWNTSGKNNLCAHAFVILINCFRRLGLCPIKPDVAFVCNGGVVYTNRIIVASRCPTLRAMLLSGTFIRSDFIAEESSRVNNAIPKTTGMKESYQPEIKLDIPYDAFVKVNEFFYRDTSLVVNNGELLLRLFVAARYLNLERLQSYCEAKIQVRNCYNILRRVLSCRY